MVRIVRARVALIFCCLAFLAALPAPALAGAGDNARFALANGCYGLKSVAAGKFAAKGPDGAYSASAADAGGGEPFRMKATELGAYMLYGKGGDFLGGASGRAASQPRPDANADWRVESAGAAGSFRLVLAEGNRALAVDGDGRLVVVDADSAGQRGVFAF